MEIDITDLKEQLREAKRYLDSEHERLQEQIDTHNSYLKLLDHYDDVLVENEHLKGDLEQQQTENDRLHEQLDDKDRRLKEMEALLKEKEALLKEKETQLNELGKFSVGVAKKSPQEGLEKAFRIYLNTSKRKTQAKREAAKTQLLDFIATAKLEMPEDIMEALNHLDDEQLPEPAPVNTSVTVQAGGINVQQANTVAR